MNTAFFSQLKNDKQEEQFISKRGHPRRRGDQCISKIDDKKYPVENWSFGGVLINADDRNFAITQSYEIELSFRVQNRIITTAHTGTVIRKSRQKIAFEFAPLSETARKKLQTVVDDSIVSEFAEIHEE